MERNDLELKNHLNKIYEILNPTINTLVKYNLMENNNDILVKCQNIYWIGFISKDSLTQQFKFEIYNPNCDNIDISHYYNHNNKFTWDNIIVKRNNNNISNLSDLRMQLRELHLKESLEYLESLLNYECYCSIIYGNSQITILLEVKNKNVELFLNKYPCLKNLKFIKIEEYILEDDKRLNELPLKIKNNRKCCLF